ncbi:MAG TPA: hypothetical protein VMT32_22125 [Bryobacteraceae bacterium]|nr:hypothetical protein [Bryobacteraceae bacterium]
MRATGIAGLVLMGSFACAGQEWEIGAAAGYGLYRNASVDAPDGKATAGVRNRFALSGVLGQDLFEFFSGEIRYLYQDGDPFLSASGAKANIQGQSHAIHYDVLAHFSRRESRIRPYLAVGLGAKWYVVSGPENPTQPLGDIAHLTNTNEFKPLLTAGGGVKLRFGSLLVRLDFRDYITPFPKKVIAPAPFATARGLFQQFTPMVGVSYSF